MRSTKSRPFGEVCEKKRLRAMAREWRRAAVRSLRFSRSGRRSWRARSAFSTHRVARISVRFATWSAEAFAEAQPLAADADGAAKSSRTSSGDDRDNRSGRTHALLQSESRA